MIKISVRFLFLNLLLCAFVVSGQETFQNGVAAWWKIPYAKTFDAKGLKVQQKISVRGNQFYDEDGKVFVFRGMNIAAPDRVLAEGQWNKRLFEELKDWGANTVRLPIHPIGWRLTGEKKILEMIDEAVVWANSLDMYIIIDWHSIGYLPDGLFQRHMYRTSEQETLTFWQTIASRYVGVNTVAVYEIFNEPTDIGGKAGKADWQVWKAFNEKVIDLIYAHDNEKIPLVAGFNWAYDLSYVIESPIEREGVAYVSHPYPQKEQPDPRTKESLFKLWTESWGHVADTYPIIATEIGWVSADGRGAHIPVIDDGSYGPMIAEYMKSKGISWTGWCFDPAWSPTMIEDWTFKPTQQGKFFKQLLQSYE